MSDLNKLNEFRKNTKSESSIVPNVEYYPNVNCPFCGVIHEAKDGNLISCDNCENVFMVGNYLKCIIKIHDYIALLNKITKNHWSATLLNDYNSLYVFCNNIRIGYGSKNRILFNLVHYLNKQKASV